ncbi:STAS domain-containing protein [candidate division KSB1 bacterium]|nr:STAS domain-containing protein [candidate division KSB1 bacterium]
MAVRTTTINNLDIAIMELRGAITGYRDGNSIQKQAADLLEQGNRKLIIDLANVTVMNSYGIGSLLNVYARYRSFNGHIKLCHMNRSLQNLFVMTKPIMIFDVEESQREAISGVWK